MKINPHRVLNSEQFKNIRELVRELPDGISSIALTNCKSLKCKTYNTLLTKLKRGEYRIECIVDGVIVGMAGNSVRDFDTHNHVKIVFLEFQL